MTPDTDTRTCGQDMGHRTRLLETDRTQVGDLRRRTSESCDRPENVNKSTVSSKKKSTHAGNVAKTMVKSKIRLRLKVVRTLMPDKALEN